jgi:hypothetical protein
MQYAGDFRTAGKKLANLPAGKNFTNFEMPKKINLRNFLMAISNVFNRHYLTICCLVIVQYSVSFKFTQI